MGLVDLLEALLCRRIIFTHVGMTGSSEFAIFLFDLFLARITLYAKDLVVIFVFQQCTSKKLMDLR
jgi:hypothetical protein